MQATRISLIEGKIIRWWLVRITCTEFVRWLLNNIKANKNGSRFVEFHLIDSRSYETGLHVARRSMPKQFALLFDPYEATNPRSDALHRIKKGVWEEISANSKFMWVFAVLLLYNKDTKREGTKLKADFSCYRNI